LFGFNLATGKLDPVAAVHTADLADVGAAEPALGTWFKKEPYHLPGSIPMVHVMLCDLQVRKLVAGIVLITQELPMLSNVAERIAVMYAGQIVEVAATDEIVGTPRHPYTRALLASALVPDPSIRGTRIGAFPERRPTCVIRRRRVASIRAARWRSRRAGAATRRWWSGEAMGVCWRAPGAPDSEAQMVINR
jgi:Oligopeptide/dipeptide transporter, C-terminal region